MKTRTKLLSLLLCAAMLLPLFACSGSQSAGTPAPKDTAAPAASSAPAASGAAEGYPNRVITMIVNYSAGGGTDLSARAFGDAISKALGGNITVTNLPGGTCSLGGT